MNAARSIAAGLALALASAAGAAQPVGPPIPPDQVFRSQPMPQTTVPPPPSSPPVGPSQPPPRGAAGQRGPEPRASAPGDRARDCQHQAAVERVPARDRASYVHTCLQGN
ncbi:MAG: hypothetical protein IT538_11615 [Variibacter sp.]|nr:hypothetical protein [Variibacter sp.]